MNEHKLQEIQQLLQFSGNFLITNTENTTILPISLHFLNCKARKLSCVIGNEMIGNHNHFTYHLK